MHPDPAERDLPGTSPSPDPGAYQGAPRSPVGDPRIATLRAVVGRVEGAALGVIRLATVGAGLGGVAGLVLWWSAAGNRIDDGGEATVVSLLVLALCAAPAGWLLNVRFSLLALLELPEKLTGVTMRRGAQLLGAPPNDVSTGGRSTGRLAALRSLRGVLRDYGDVVGSWATVAQLLAPTFWVLTGLALLAVPVLVIGAAVAGLFKAFV